MIIEFATKNYSSSERLQGLIAKKLERLDKFFEPDTKAKVMLKSVQQFAGQELFFLELTILADNALLRAEVSDKDMFATIDLAIPKLEKQIIKHRQKVAAKTKKFKERAITVTDVNQAESHRNVVKSKTYVLTPMTVEDAIEEQELVGHNFFVFLNKATNGINILYKRNDGDYGLIETQV